MVKAMLRDEKKTSKTGVYHIVFYGRDLFREDNDSAKMLYVLEKCADITKVRIHAYCLMTNHVHLLAQAGKEPGAGTPAEFVKRVGIRYAKYFNYKYNRAGPLFGGRYKSEAVETDVYFLTVLRFIHRNPVKAGIVKTPAEYKNSSYGAYTGDDSFVYTGSAVSLLGDCFEAYMQEDDGTKCLDTGDAVRRVTARELSAEIEKMIRRPAADIRLLEREARNRALRRIAGTEGVTYRLISGVTGLSPSVISRAVNKTNLSYVYCIAGERDANRRNMVKQQHFCRSSKQRRFGYADSCRNRDDQGNRSGRERRIRRMRDHRRNRRYGH